MNKSNFRSGIFDGKIIGWWSGGGTSAVACALMLEMGNPEEIEIVMIDTFNEDPDTYRFKEDCEKLYNKKIHVISTQDFEVLKHYTSVKVTWYKHVSLNTANGAICSSVMKRRVREEFQKSVPDIKYQVFGFEAEPKEFNRSLALKMNHPKANPVYPLLYFGYTKKMCLQYLEDRGIRVPNTYLLGFQNNNCFSTGCVQGGIGYWQKMAREFPEKFEDMAQVEHELTELKGSPVTMLKDQSKVAKATVKETGIKWKQFVFLKPHPDYPELKSLADMEGREPEPLMECHGMCSLNDLNPKKDIGEINLIEE